MLGRAGRWPDAPVAPSGAQYRISHRAQVATVTEVGATLRQYSVGERPVIDGFALDAACDGGRGQPLVPWPNRLADGRYRFGGRDIQAGLDDPERNNAIHGLVRWLNWELAEKSESRVTMGIVVHPQPGYPFSLGVGVSYSLDDDGLTVSLHATNLGREELPMGAGFHPYLTTGHGRIDEARLRLRASRRLLADERGLPTGDAPVQSSRYDFGDGRLIGDTVMDVAFSDLDRDSDGRARVDLDDPRSGDGVTLWADERFTYLMCFTGDTLSDPAARRRGLAVEPMTCPPNALRTGEGLIVLAPSESVEARWGLTARPATT
jgi:aldose 1-epimerase